MPLLRFTYIGIRIPRSFSVNDIFFTFNDIVQFVTEAYSLLAAKLLKTLFSQYSGKNLGNLVDFLLW
jgi:hypothetical protein